MLSSETLSATSRQYPLIDDSLYSLYHTFLLDSVVHCMEKFDVVHVKEWLRLFFFLIWDTNPGSVFMILPNNGVITVNGSLDRETKDSYSLRIGVSNFERYRYRQVCHCSDVIVYCSLLAGWVTPACVLLCIATSRYYFPEKVPWNFPTKRSWASKFTTNNNKFSQTAGEFMSLF